MLRSITGLVAGVLLVSTVIGCSARTTPAQPVAAGEPRKGGVLKVAFPGNGATDSLHPYENSLYVDGSRSKALFDRLFEFDSTLKPVPHLAEKATPNQDLNEWTLTLRQANFHDGKPVTATDVLESFKAISANPKAVAASSIKSIDLAQSKVINDRELSFKLVAKEADFTEKLAEYGTQILPGGVFDPTKPIGSGPFKFESFAPGRSTVLVRNDNYWGGAPYLDKLEFVIASDEAARVNALSSGQVQFINDISATTTRSLAGNKAISVVKHPASTHRSFAMKTDRAPFNNPKVRQAFKFLIDREEMRRVVLNGEGVLGNDVFGTTGQNYYPKDLPTTKHDLAQAQALLKEAGTENLSVTLDVTDGVPGMKESALVFADQAKKAGVTISINVLPLDNYWTKTKTEGHMSGYGGGAMTLGQHIRTRVLCDAKNNYPKWCDESLTLMQQQIQATADETERAKLYSSIMTKHHDEGGHIIWAISDMLSAASTKVHGIDGAAPSNTLNWARFDKIWLSN